ncbi:MAG: TonB-dependent receptor [Tannerella sp.]|jgi:TonB-linked SusC/RagA family outer membrane protein|nr:TonB-dependent receptor [Tannerella sp.]
MKKIIFIATLILTFCAATVQAQQVTVTGKVIDELDDEVPGATVYLKNKVGIGTTTDADGKFTIKANVNDILEVSYIGYAKAEHLVTAKSQGIVIKLEESAEQLEEVVVMGMGSTQRKISTVGAISSVSAKELQSPSPSIVNLLGGRLAGVFTMQTSGEPGKNLAEFWIRGVGTFGANSSALVLIDGLEGDLNSIDPSDVESFSVLKDASATAVYGVRGANGVVLVTTKRGEIGKLNIQGRFNASLSHLRRLPDYIGGYDYALLANEANIIRGGDAIYTPLELEIIKDHLDPDMYPDIDWQKELVKKASWKQSYYVSGRGGGDIARYFLSLSMTDETAAYNVDKKSIYAQNVGYSTFSFRSNLDIDLTKTTKLYFGSDGFMSRRKEPGFSNTDLIWDAQARNNPLLIPIKYSTGQFPATGADVNVSPYYMINNSGSHASEEYKAKVTLELKQNLSFITEGLNIRAQGAYDITQGFQEYRTIRPAMYEAIGRNRNGDLILVERVQEQQAGYLYSTSEYRKYFFESTLNYSRLFNELHRVSGLVYYYISDSKKTEDLTSALNAIPVRYQGLSSRLTYSYNDTYLMDLNFGYTGSENFQPGRQYGFFPSVALGWVPTQYDFMSEKVSWLTFFKIRASYGSVGNDRISNRRFPYLTMVGRYYNNLWGSSTSYQTVNESFIGADNLIWEKALKANIGIDAEILHKKFSFTVDFFRDQRDGIFQQRVQVPDIVGVISMPYGNVGKMQSYGSDGNVAFIHEFNTNMSMTFRGNYSYSRNIVQNWEQAIEKYPYLEYSGLPHNIYRGYRAIGLFKDDDDVKYSPKQTFGNVMPGDIKYMDVNGDGKVDSEDKVPLSYSTYPRLMYGFGGDFRYKDLSIGVMFRGTGKTDYYHEGNGNGAGYVPFRAGQYGNVLTMAADPKNRWIPLDYALANGIDPALAENPNARFPRLQYGENTNNSQLSDFWLGDSRYLRLSEVTLNYNLKHAAIRKIGISSIDMQLVGSNLWMWDKVKLFDPEQATHNGRKYPIPSVYSIQIYINL